VSIDATLLWLSHSLWDCRRAYRETSRPATCHPSSPIYW
jgi:hypothetical protein